MIYQKTNNNIEGNRESCDNISSSVPTSPVEQTPLKLSTNIGRNPLRGSKCNSNQFPSLFLLPFYYGWVIFTLS